MAFRPDPYWLVHGAGPTNHRHASKRSAIDEAERLARANPGQTFIVLEPVEAVRLVDVERFRFGEEPEEELKRPGSLRSRYDLADDIPF